MPGPYARICRSCEKAFETDKRGAWYCGAPCVRPDTAEYNRRHRGKWGRCKSSGCGRGTLVCSLCKEPKAEQSTLYCQLCARGKAAEVYRRYVETPEGRAKQQAKSARWNGDKPARKADHLRRAYGLTPAEVEARRIAIGDACEICRRKFQPGRGRLQMNIDHCHASGKPRGLLCNDCNTGLGFFADDADRLAAAFAYLKRAKP